jgi:hypothetical protein
MTPSVGSSMRCVSGANSHAHVCSRMLTYAHVCSRARMLTYADGQVCLWRELGRAEEALEVLRAGLKLQPNCAYTMLTYADVC